MQVEDMKAKWIGVEFDEAKFEVSEQEMLDFAIACGEEEPKFADPTDADFQASPTFTAKLVSRGRVMPELFPRIGGGGFDAGKRVEVHAPLRPGDTLVGRSRIADIYEKTGRSGSMVFIVHQMEFRNQRDELVSIVDWRMVRTPPRE